MARKNDRKGALRRNSNEEFIDVVTNDRPSGWAGQKQKTLYGGGLRGVRDAFRTQNDVIGKRKTVSEWETEQAAHRAKNKKELANRRARNFR